MKTEESTKCLVLHALKKLNLKLLPKKMGVLKAYFWDKCTKTKRENNHYLENSGFGMKKNHFDLYPYIYIF